MLKIFPIQDKNEQERACLRCRISYEADAMAYQATVDEQLVGICQFAIHPDGGILLDLAPLPDREADHEALFLMARAALNFIDLCGVHRAFFDGDPSLAGDSLLHAIGFRHPDDASDTRLTMDLTDFFSAPCQHQHKDSAD